MNAIVVKRTDDAEVLILFNINFWCDDAISDSDSDVLLDETFDGGIWLMYVPQEIVALSKDIDKWNETNGKVLDNPYQSENFAGTYSYTKKQSSSGGSYTWRDHFAHRLNRWRKV